MEGAGVVPLTLLSLIKTFFVQGPKSLLVDIGGRPRPRWTEPRSMWGSESFSLDRSKAGFVALTFSILAFVLILSSSWNDSPCYDEPEHITAGFSYVDFNCFFLNCAHPPLVKELSGWSVKLFSGQPSLKSWGEFNVALAVQELFSGEQVAVQTLTRVARAPIIVLSSLFAGLFFLTVRQRLGDRVALLCAGLLLLSPNFIAHAGLVHTDAGASALSFLALWFLAGYLEAEPSARRAAAFGLVAAVAVLVKFSCLLLAPIYFVSILLRSDRLARLKHLPLVFLIVLGMIQLVYSSHLRPAFFHKAYLSYQFENPDRGAVGLILRTADNSVLNPLGWYATGVLVQGRRVHKGNSLPGYLRGKVYYGGDPTYFPTVLVTKLPPGLFLLGALSLWGLRQRRFSIELQLYASFAALYALVAISSGLNLGLRHVLPIFPCLQVLCAAGLDRGLELASGGKFKGLVALGFAGLMVSSLLAWPNYLRYFNLLAARSVPVVDSNYDWGTDLHRLSERAESQDWSPLHVKYFGGFSPGAYLGERYQELDPNQLPEKGWAAVSETIYLPLMEGDDSRLPAPQREGRAAFRAWMESLQEVERVGTFVVLKIQ